MTRKRQKNKQYRNTDKKQVCFVQINPTVPTVKLLSKNLIPHQCIRVTTHYYSYILSQ